MAYPTILPAASTAEPGVLFVAILGICIVMIGLFFIILLCTLMSRVCGLLAKTKKSAPEKANAAPSAPADSSASIPNRSELVAAISAAIAEDLGTDVSAIRVHSLKKIG